MSWRQYYPFTSHFLALANGLRLHYVDEGQGDCLLLVHGNPTWSFHFRKLILDWRTSYRVVAPDHLGCGLSDKPQTFDYCLARHTENLLRLVEQLDVGRITVIGHDWGGAIALNAVRFAPDQFQRIVLLNTGAFPPLRVPRRIAVCRLPVLGPLGVRGLNIFPRAALRMAMHNPRMLSAGEQQGVLAPYNSWKNRIGIQRFIDDIPLSSRHRTWIELAQLERSLPDMTGMARLLIWGMRDWCFDQHCLERFLSIWPDAEVLRCEDAGHWVIEDQPARIGARVREFIESKHIQSVLPTSTSVPQ